MGSDESQATVNDILAESNAQYYTEETEPSCPEYNNDTTNEQLVAHCSNTLSKYEVNQNSDDGILLPDTKLTKTTEFNWKNLFPMHYSKYHGHERKAFITLSNIKKHEDIVEAYRFTENLNVVLQDIHSDNTTHVVVSTNQYGECKRTKKVFHAIIRNIYIVTMQWVKDCLESGFLISEHHYLPSDFDNQSILSRSLQVKLGIIDSPMEWIKYCAIYVYELETVPIHRWYNEIREGMKYLGCQIVDNMADFQNVESNIERIILVNISKETYSNLQVPSASTIKRWFVETGAVTVHIEWMFESLTNYKCLNINDYEIQPSNDSNVSYVIVID